MKSREPISAGKFEELLQGASGRILRVEALPEYNSPADRAIYDSYLRGIPLPPLGSSPLKDWAEIIRNFCKRGIKFQRLRLMPEKLTPYLRYEIDWAYSFSKDFGEETRFQPLSTTGENLRTDFYVLDDTKLLHMEYENDGTWLGFSLEKDSANDIELIRASSESWESAASLELFLANYRKRSM